MNNTADPRFHALFPDPWPAIPDPDPFKAFNPRSQRFRYDTELQNRSFQVVERTRIGSLRNNDGNNNVTKQ